MYSIEKSGGCDRASLRTLALQSPMQGILRAASLVMLHVLPYDLMPSFPVSDYFEVRAISAPPAGT